LVLSARVRHELSHLVDCSDHTIASNSSGIEDRVNFALVGVNILSRSSVSRGLDDCSDKKCVKVVSKTVNVKGLSYIYKVGDLTELELPRVSILYDINA
jgi:hypothetical protein